MSSSAEIKPGSPWKISQSQGVYLVLGLIVLVNLIWKLLLADKGSLYLDEAGSIWHAQQDWEHFWEFLGREPNPPLYYILLKGWMAVFGDGLTAVRGLSVLFSTGAAVLLLFLGKRLFSLRVGIAAAVFFTLSDIQFHFAHEARTYALCTFLTCASAWFFLRLLDQKQRKDLLLLTLCNIALIYSHYTGFFFVAAEALLLPFLLPQRAGRQLLLSLLLTALAVLPVLLRMDDQKSGVTFWLAAPKWEDLGYFFKDLLGGKGLHLLFMASTVVALGLLLVKERLQARIAFLWLWAFVPLVIAFFISDWVPLFLPKYLVFTVPPFLLLLAYCIDRFSLNVWLFAGLLGTLALWQLSALQTGKSQEHWKSAVEYVKSIDRHPEGKILISAPYQAKTFLYYYDIDLFRAWENYQQVWYKAGIIAAHHPGIDFFEYQNPPEMILIQSHASVVDPENMSKRIFESRYQLVDSWEGKGIKVSVYR